MPCGHGAMLRGHFVNDTATRPARDESALPDIEVEPLPLLSSAQLWWAPPRDVRAAAGEFDKRHRTLSRRAQAMMRALEQDATSGRKADAVDALTNETR
eukprot:5080994-Prymnesium_polylepis.1